MGCNNKIIENMQIKENIYKIQQYSLIFYSFILIYLFTKSLNLSHELPISTIQFYIKNFLFIMFASIVYYSILTFIFKVSSKIFTFILMSTYFMFVTLGYFIDGFERYLFIITSILSYIFMSYTVIDILLNYNIFEPIKKKYLIDIYNERNSNEK